MRSDILKIYTRNMYKKTGRKRRQRHLKYEMHFATSTQINCDRDIQMHHEELHVKSCTETIANNA